MGWRSYSGTSGMLYSTAHPLKLYLPSFLLPLLLLQVCWGSCFETSVSSIAFLSRTVYLWTHFFQLKYGEMLMVGNFQKQWKCDRKKGEQRVEWKHGWWRRVIWGRKQGDRKEERCVFVGVCVWRGCAVLCGPLRWVQWQHMVRGWTACSLPNTLTQWGSVWWTWGMLRDGRTVEKEVKRGFVGERELGKG